MQTNLRPMSLGEILDRTAQLYRTNFVLFAGIAAIYAGVLLILNLSQIGLQQLLLHMHMTQQLPWVTLGYLLLIFPLMVIFAGMAVAANNRAVSWVNLDQPATIRGAYASILPQLGRYIWLTTIVTFIVYIPFVVLFIAYFAFLFIYARPKGLFIQGGANASPQAAIVLGLVTLAFVILALGATVYAVMMLLRYSLAIPAAVIEDLKARQAIRRSVELSKESRGRIFVLLLLIFVIELGLIMLTQAFFVVAVFVAAKHHQQPPLWVQILEQIVGFFTNSFIGPMYATGLTLFYYDQRVRKEGYDIEWMMEAAGMVAPPAPQPQTEAQPSAVPSAAPPPVIEPAPNEPAENPAEPAHEPANPAFGEPV
jgi:hypothetical protein